MSIEKRYSPCKECGHMNVLYVAVCDYCGDELEPQKYFEAAMSLLRDNDWRIKQDEDGTYIHICPDCYESLYGYER